MLRIRDPKPSLDFYTRVLGMTLLAKLDFPSMAFTLYFLGYEKQEDIPDDPVERVCVQGRRGKGGPCAAHGHALGLHDGLARRGARPPACVGGKGGQGASGCAMLRVEHTLHVHTTMHTRMRAFAARVLL